MKRQLTKVAGATLLAGAVWATTAAAARPAHVDITWMSISNVWPIANAAVKRALGV
jgi:hypothetical protein